MTLIAETTLTTSRLNKKRARQQPSSPLKNVCENIILKLGGN